MPLRTNRPVLQRRMLIFTCKVTTVCLVVSLLYGQKAFAQFHYNVLHGFSGTHGDGAEPQGSVALDSAGSVYGTTGGGGIYGAGVVFELISKPNGTWSEALLHTFDGTDGAWPTGGPTLDVAGNVYGTTSGGGAHNGGTVFQLRPSEGTWTEETIYDFCAEPNCIDGTGSWASLMLDNAGDLFGTGSVVFELVPLHDGNWTEMVLHTFAGTNGDALDARAGVIADANGNLYGTAGDGGGSNKCIGGCGIVYELSPIPDDPESVWQERILHAFGISQNDGQLPLFGQLAMDRRGNLYGTTSQGGANLCFAGCGTVFELSHTSTGHWVERVLYNFKFDSSGFGPGGSVVIDKAGNLYGTTINGGSENCGCGVVYKLSPQPGGQWQYTVLHTFVGADGAQPDANLTLDDNGNIYGTTLTGGPGGAGVVFEITP